MISIGLMIKKLEGMIDTKDLTPWENQFCTDMVEKTNGGDITKHLSDNQVEKVQQIYNKHFA